MDDDDIALSRSSPFPIRLGKATNRVSAYLPDQVANDLMIVLRAKGVSESEYLGALISKDLYGVEQARRMYQERFDAALGFSPESDREAAT